MDAKGVNLGYGVSGPVKGNVSDKRVRIVGSGMSVSEFFQIGSGEAGRRCGMGVGCASWNVG